MSWIEDHPSEFGSYDLSNLKIDQAIVNFKLNASIPLWVYELSSNCLRCPFQIMLSPSSSGTLDYTQTIGTTFPLKYRLRTTGNATYVPEDDDPHKFCDIDHNFGEFGIYEVLVNDDASVPNCRVDVVLEPVNIYLPILLVVFFFIFLEIIVWIALNYQKILPDTICGRRIWHGQSEMGQASEESGQRLKSLDVFRGICILLMIFVHDGAGSYTFMQHATWDGLQVADLIFPWFLWIMGACIPMSLKSYYKKSQPQLLTVVRKILMRSLKLLFLGLILGTIGQSSTNLKHFRFFGVLQRFSITYLICSSLALLCLHSRYLAQNGIFYHRNSDAAQDVEGALYVSLKDVIILWKGWAAVSILVVVHLLLTFLLPVPGCPTGYLGPGGLHENGRYPVHCVGGAAGYIDRQVWGSSHLFQWPTVNEVYNHGDGIPYDPEGTLGFLTATLQVWTGVQFGVTIMEFSAWSSFLPRAGLWATLQGLVAGLLCNWEHAGGLIPINKNLWSISFVLATNCMALVLFACLYIIIDRMKLWSGTPMIQPGKNAILLYVTHLVVQKMLPWHWSLGDMNSHFWVLVESMWGISLWVLISIYLDTRRLYLKL